MTKRWIGVIGKNGSGKSTVCDHLEQQGFQFVSLSDVVRQHAKQSNVSLDRDSLTNLANQLKHQYGIDYFARSSLKSIQEKNYTDVVFDSIRHPAEIEFLKQYNVFFIGLNAPIEQRYQRIAERGKQTDFVSFDEFKRQDSYESSGDSYGQRILDAMSLCHVTINNDSNNICNLLDQIDDIIKKKLVDK